MNRFVVGIDCGSQSAKVAVFDADGQVVATGQQLLRPCERPHHGLVVHPDDDLWDAIGAATRHAVASMEQMGFDRSLIGAVGLCAVRCCKAFLDADGNLVEPVISWMDDRAYAPYVPAVDAATSAAPAAPTTWATTASGHLMHRLTGKFVDTAANYIAMQWPIDTDTWTWADDDQIRRSRLRRDQLMPLQMPGEIGGHVTAAAAVATHLPEGIPVVHTANDKAVEILGAGGLHSDGEVLLSLGTYICAMVEGTVNHATPADFWTNAACLPHRYLYESGGVRRGMWTLTWLLDLLGPEFAERAEREMVLREQLLEREAVATPPGSDGLLTVLDWLAPTDHPHRRGMMIGFDARHTRGHLYRSVMEAIAITMAHHVSAMFTELGRTVERVVVTGGGANSDLFMQILADVFGVPAMRLQLPDGVSPAAVGAAACALAALDASAGSPANADQIVQAARQLARSQQAFNPQPAVHAHYRAVSVDVYQHIRAATDPLLQRAHALATPSTEGSHPDPSHPDPSHPGTSHPDS